MRISYPYISRYKTALCTHWQESGACQFGEKCVYAHGTHELRQLSAKALALRAQGRKALAEKKQHNERKLEEAKHVTSRVAE